MFIVRVVSVLHCVDIKTLKLRPTQDRVRGKKFKANHGQGQGNITTLKRVKADGFKTEDGSNLSLVASNV